MRSTLNDTLTRPILFADRARPRTGREQVFAGKKPVAEPQGTPKCIDRFQIREMIGRGGQAIVWRAYDPINDRFVAVKRLLRSADDDPSALLRLRREAHLGQAIRHPGLARVLDSGHAADGPWIAFELIEGQTLAALLEKRGFDSLGSEATEFSGQDAGAAMHLRPPAGLAELMQRLRWLRDLVRIVHTLHKSGVLHRDLKPENVLITGDDRVVLLDLGLAGITDPSEPRIREPGSACGTPSYMAPELLGGQSDGLKEAADIWALGIMLYEATTGTRPFGGHDLEALTSAVTSEAALPPSRLLPWVPRSLERLIERCLERDPEKRFRSAGALLAALDRTLEELLDRVDEAWCTRRRRGGLRAAACVFVLFALRALLPQAPAPGPLAPPLGRDTAEIAGISAPAPMERLTKTSEPGELPRADFVRSPPPQTPPYSDSVSPYRTSTPASSREPSRAIGDQTSKSLSWPVTTENR